MPSVGSAQLLLLVPCGAPLFLELDRPPSGYVLPEEWAAAEPYLGHPVQIEPVLQYKGMAACLAPSNTVLGSYSVAAR